MIPYLNLKKTNADYEAEFKAAFSSFLNVGHYIRGQQVSDFENAFAKYRGTQYCCGTANGLDALTLILKGNKELGSFRRGRQGYGATCTYY